jgi:hypothetical protein
MNITFTTNPNVSLSIPIQFLFWGFVAAYVIHILEESVLGENFVDKVRKNFIPFYDWTKFFWFNAFLLSLNVVAIIVYDIGGGRWIIFPLSLAVERTLNGIWHFGETVVTRKFSSGLLASILTWILAYLLIRYSLLEGEILPLDFSIAFVIGALITAFMFGTLFITKAKTMKHPSQG